MRAIYRGVKSSVQKLNLVADLIRGTKVDSARCILMFSRKFAARNLYKVLMSSVANAQNNFSADIDSLYIKSVLIGKGMTLKRFFPRARGRSARVSKYYSNVTIMLDQAKGGLDGSEG